VRWLRNVWDAMPESNTKKAFRVAAHNILQRGQARFHRDEGIYVAEFLNFQLRTVEPSFEVLRILGQFEARHRVSTGEVVIDAGAFRGMLTNVFALQVGATGRVLAFEPDGINRGYTSRNLELNGNPGHVDVTPLGLWDCETEIEFCERGALGSSAFWDGPGGRKVSIPTITLDQAVRERGLGRVDFVKMNIEGAEIKALQGAKQTIQRFRPQFAISSDHFLNGDSVRGERTCMTVEQLLQDYGYATETVRYGTEWVTYGMSKP
jgi:FkbM family methyltransferase